MDKQGEGAMLSAAFSAPLMERAAALRMLLSTLWPEFLQLTVPARAAVAAIVSTSTSSNPPQTVLLSLVVVLRVLRTVLAVTLAIVRAPILLLRRSPRQQREGQQQQAGATGATTTTTTTAGGRGGRGKGGAVRRRGGVNATPAAAAAAAATTPTPAEGEPPKRAPPGVSLKSLVAASRSAKGGAAASGAGGASGAPQPPPSASTSPLHLSWLKGHGDGIASVCFSSDGAFLLSASRDRGLRQWPFPPSLGTALKKGAPPTPAQPRTRALSVSPLAASYLGGDSSRGIVVLSRDGLNGPTLHALPAFGSSGNGDASPLWTASPLPLIGGRRPVALLCSSSPSSPESAPLVAVVSERTELETFDAESGRRTAAVDTGGLRTHGASCSANGTLFAAATFASDAKVYAFGGGGGGGGGHGGSSSSSSSRGSSVQKAGWSLSHSGQVLAVSLSRDGSRAATSSRDGTWASWKTPPRVGSGKLPSGERAEATRIGAWKQDLPPDEFYRLLALSPDGSVLAAAAGGDLHFLCSSSGSLLGAVSPAHGGEVASLCWSPLRRRVVVSPPSEEERGEEVKECWILASGGDDRAVRLWVAPEAASTGFGGGWQRA